MCFNKYTAIALVLLTVAGACKKDESPASAADPFYEVAVDGYTVTFNNTTSGATSYKWDFGDGESSTEQSPVHTYPGKGKYVPTLYATDAKGKVAEASTVIRIGKFSGIKMDDNSLSDWDTISTYVVTPPATETYFKKAKFDYDGNYVYIYFEVKSNATAGDIFDFYIDADNDATTGVLTGTFPGGGYEVLLEGSMLINEFGNFVHKGAQNSFSFDDTGITEFYSIGTKVQDGDILKFEMRLVRSKIKNLAASTAFRIGIEATTVNWGPLLGDLPGAGQAPVQISFE
jgi:hypothetical protein